MTEISATEAARNFADLLDAVEHRGERFTVVRRGRVVARLEPAPSVQGQQLKDVLRRHRRDASWGTDLTGVRELLVLEERT